MNDRKQLINSLRANPNSNAYTNLMLYLDTVEYETLRVIAKTDEPIEIYRLQGACRFIDTFRRALTRKPVISTHTGAFD